VRVVYLQDNSKRHTTAMFFCDKSVLLAIITA